METVTIAASRPSVFTDIEVLLLGAVFVGAIIVMVVHRARTMRD